MGRIPKGTSNGDIYNVFCLKMRSWCMIEFNELFLLKLELSASLMHPSLRLFTWNSRPAGAIALWSLTGAAISQKSLIWFLLDSEPGQSECGKVRRVANYNSADLGMQPGLACSHDSADGHFEKQSIQAKKCISWLLQLQYGQRKPIFISSFVSMHSIIGELTVSFPVFPQLLGWVPRIISYNASLFACGIAMLSMQRQPDFSYRFQQKKWM